MKTQLRCICYSLIMLTLSNTGTSAKGFMVMPCGGYGGMIYLNNNLKDYALKQSGGSFDHIGVQAGYMFTKNIGLFTGIGRNSYQWRVVTTDPAYPYNNKIKQTYLEIPVFARFATGKEHHIGFLAKVGLSLAFLQSAEERIYDGTNSGTSTDKDGYEPVILNVRYTIGVHIPIGKLIWIDAGPECRYSINPNYKDKTVSKAISSPYPASSA